MRSSLPASLLLVFSWAEAVSGHDLWLVAKKSSMASGEEAGFLAVNGTRFPVSENAVAPDRLEALFLAPCSGERIPVRETAVEDQALGFRVGLGKEGAYWAAVATKPKLISLKAADFNEYLGHDGLPHVLEARRSKGIADRDEIERYSKCAKAIVRVGEAGGGLCRQPLGLRVEIVPDADLFSLRPGMDLPCQVLFEGKPLAGFLLQAGYEGMEGPRLECRTDAGGRARFRIAREGHWYLRGIHMVEVEGKDYHYESFWASLTFRME